MDHKLWESPLSVGAESFLKTAYASFMGRKQLQAEQAEAEAERAYEERKTRSERFFNLAQTVVEQEKQDQATTEKRGYEEGRWTERQDYFKTKAEEQDEREHEYQIELDERRHGQRMKEIGARESGKSKTKGEKPLLTLIQARTQYRQWQKDAIDYQEGGMYDPGELSVNVRKALEYYGELEREIPITEKFEPKVLSKPMKIKRALNDLMLLLPAARNAQSIAKIAETYGLLNPNKTLDDDFARALGLGQ